MISFKRYVFSKYVPVLIILVIVVWASLYILSKRNFIVSYEMSEASVTEPTYDIPYPDVIKSTDYFEINDYSITSNRFSILDYTDFSGADNVSGFPYPIVPNIIHLVHFGKPELNFAELVLIKTVYANHKPDKIMIHCDCIAISGTYWDLVKDIKVLEVRFKAKPADIFGRPYLWIQHASDLARLEILMEHGGIYLDSDVYVLSSLDEYRKFEFTADWDDRDYFGNQVLIAHKNARYLKLWHETYREFDGSKWYYNAGELPKERILRSNPGLVHRVNGIFGVLPGPIQEKLFRERRDWKNEWKDMKTIHAIIRYQRKLYPGQPFWEFDLENIKTYNYTYGDMARLAIFGSSEIVN